MKKGFSLKRPSATRRLILGRRGRKVTQRVIGTYNRHKNIREARLGTVAHTCNLSTFTEMGGSPEVRNSRPA